MVNTIQNWLSNFQRHQLLEAKVKLNNKMLKKAAMTLLRRQVVFALKDILWNYHIYQNKLRGEKIMKRAGARLVFKAAALLDCI